MKIYVFKIFFSTDPWQVTEKCLAFRTPARGPSLDCPCCNITTRLNYNNAADRQLTVFVIWVLRRRVDPFQYVGTVRTSIWLENDLKWQTAFPWEENALTVSNSFMAMAWNCRSIHIFMRVCTLWFRIGVGPTGLRFVSRYSNDKV